MMHPKAHIGAITLMVGNLERLSAFYNEVIALKVLESSPQKTTLGANQSKPLLHLVAAPHASPFLPKSVGLFHLALQQSNRCL